ncbi:MAG: DUF3108 domain-containing protein [Gammaproteobacteria bacterium]|nr:MAG: DUF3108 domain-containing protein [Gammaproteobacteria bacterium]
MRKLITQFTAFTILILHGAFLPVIASGVPLSPFKATYSLTKEGTEVGLAHYELSKIDHTWWRYSATSEITGWLSYVVDADVTEQSIWRWNNGHMQVREYRYDQTGREKHVKLYFDWEKQRVTNDIDGDRWKMNILDGTLDKLSVNLALMAHMKQHQSNTSFAVADGGKLKTYIFNVAGKEMIETPLGHISCIKIKRNKRGRAKNKETTMWLAPSLNYLIVKLEKKNRDGDSMLLQIQSLN